MKTFHRIGLSEEDCFISFSREPTLYLYLYSAAEPVYFSSNFGSLPSCLQGSQIYEGVPRSAFILSQVSYHEVVWFS